MLLKLSGEAFAGEAGHGIDGQVVEQIAREVVEVRTDLGVDVAIVVGGGNLWRGRTGALSGMDRTQADHMGMLATVMNALALQDTLERLGQATRVQSAIHMAQVAEPYIRRRAVRHLEKGRVVIFAAGLGPSSSDTPAAAGRRGRRRGAPRRTHSGVEGVYTAILTIPRLSLREASRHRGAQPCSR